MYIASHFDCSERGFSRKLFFETIDALEGLGVDLHSDGSAIDIEFVKAYLEVFRDSRGDFGEQIESRTLAPIGPQELRLFFRYSNPLTEGCDRVVRSGFAGKGIGVERLYPSPEFVGLMVLHADGESDPDDDQEQGGEGQAGRYNACLAR